MKRGEKAVLALIGLVLVAGVVKSELHVDEKDRKSVV